MRRIVTLLTCLAVLLSCNFSSSTRTEKLANHELKENLSRVSGINILFGHQDDLAYGIGWKAVSGESDVKRTTGSYPAVFGWDIGNIGDHENLDGVSFDSLRSYIISADKMGGINTVSWHSRNPINGFNSWDLTGVDLPAILPGGKYHSKLVEQLNFVADFFLSIKKEDSTLVPIIFRPWHEMNGGWFWWGTSACTDEDYKELYRFTVEYLRHEKGLSNLLFAFSPDAGFESKEEYLKRYPGDDVVDLLGLDDYHDFTINRLDKIVQKLSIVVDLAVENNKIVAFTETGSDKLEIRNWYTSNLLQVLKANEKTRKVAYVMVWRNKDTTHFYVPYEQHIQAEDFRSFVNDPMIFLLDEYNQSKKQE